MTYSKEYQEVLMYTSSDTETYVSISQSLPKNAKNRDCEELGKIFLKRKQTGSLIFIREQVVV